VSAVGEVRRQLIEAHLPLSRRVALRYAGRGERSDDLAQVGALALVRAVDRCDPSRGELSAYLARCIDGEVRNHLRDRASVVRRPRRASTRAAPVVPIDDELAEEARELGEATLDRAAVAAAARSLDLRERWIVLRVYYLDRPQSEVADELGISQAHVSRLLAGAIRKMRRRLEGASLRADGIGRE
jgi:RNA polymerase sigma-B factor